MDFNIELEQETDGRWIAEVVELPGTLAYGSTQDEAIARGKPSHCAQSPTASSTTRPEASI